MSSSNLVSVTYTKETAYGVKPTPGAGVTLKTARFTSESLSGTPETTVSSELRTDRMSSGQVVTGLTVGGDINFELSRDVFFDDWFAAAMMSDWVAALNVASDVTLTPDGGDDQIATLVLTTPLAGVEVGDILQIRPDTSSVAKFVVYVQSVDVPGTDFTVATTRGQAAMTDEAMLVSVPSWVEIGKDQTSFCVSKAYQDVLHDVSSDEHSQTYTGELVSGFTVDASYGSIVSGSFTAAGSGYLQEYPSYAQAVDTAGGTITPAGTTNPINASVDVPLVIASDVATDFCVESFSITLDNGLDPRTCIGKASPTGYSLGTANISISTSIYLSDTSYDAFMSGKLTQVPISLTYVAENNDGGFAFSVPAVQLTFPDPSAGGQDQQTMLEASGVAKVGPNGESALRIYKMEA